jgi:cysteine desulfurase
MEISLGDPSSTHYAGRQSRGIVDQSRNNIAEMLHCSPKNIVFTSSGTEAIYLGIRSICETYHPRAIITLFSEHEAIVRSVANAATNFTIPVIYVECNTQDDSFMAQLTKLLKDNPSSLLVFSHANYFSGEILPVEKVGKVCKKYRSMFFCNMTQTMGRYDINLGELPIDFAIASAHKFGGGKGVGLLYHKHKINPLIEGASFQDPLRAGIENVYGICSMEAALFAGMRDLRINREYIYSMKSYCREMLEAACPTIIFATDRSETVYHLLSFHLPDMHMERVYQGLDKAKIAVSFFPLAQNGFSFLRVSFGRQTTKGEINSFVETLAAMPKKKK